MLAVALAVLVRVSVPSTVIVVFVAEELGPVVPAVAVISELTEPPTSDELGTVLRVVSVAAMPLSVPVPEGLEAESPVLREVTTTVVFKEE